MDTHHREFDLDDLSAAIDAARQARGLTWEHLSREIGGIAPSSHWPIRIVLERFSAGTRPAEHVQPEVIEVMPEVGIDMSAKRPQRLSDPVVRGDRS